MSVEVRIDGVLQSTIDRGSDVFRGREKFAVVEGWFEGGRVTITNERGRRKEIELGVGDSYGTSIDEQEYQFTGI